MKKVYPFPRPFQSGKETKKKIEYQNLERLRDNFRDK